MVKMSAIIPARNEQDYIEKTLIALQKQSLPCQIIVVNDGSTDLTEQVASKYADLVVNLPDRGYEATGSPVLAQVINAGLARVQSDVDYVVIVGADHPLPPNYLEALIRRMRRNPKLVVVSGIFKGETLAETAAKGSGRVVDAKFWRSVDFKYPEVWGWESWLLFKAQQLGYEVRRFEDVVTETQRPTRLHKTEKWGKAMYALGYDWRYALRNCFLIFLKSPKAGFRMFKGWIVHKNVRRLDIADWVNQYQKRRFWKRVKETLSHRREEGF